MNLNNCLTGLVTDRKKGAGAVYYNYHATARRLIAENHLINYELLYSYNKISPCLLLHFGNHRPMPIRDYKWDEYLPLLTAERN